MLQSDLELVNQAQETADRDGSAVLSLSDRYIADVPASEQSHT